jgi:lipooligosaccharide transport system permease protein
VSLVRPLVIGEWPESVATPLAILCAWTLAAFLLARGLTRRRFRQ